MTKLEKKKSKLSFKEFVWFGFNLVFGGTFVTTFASFANSQGKNSDSSDTISHSGLGLWVLLVWFVVGMFALVCAKAFAKMSRYHDSSQNGASYVYTRSTFGKLFGLFIGFMQYCYLPFSLSFQIMSCFKANLATPFIGDDSQIKQYWGAFTDLYMDMMSITCFVLSALIVFLGMKWFKRLSNTTSYIKWFGMGLLILASFLILLSPNNGQLSGTKNLDTWTHKSKFDILLFVKCFNSSLFSFLGFELVITAGKNIENPNKTIGKGIISIVVLAIVVYVCLSLLMFCTTSIDFKENYQVAIWGNLNKGKGGWVLLGIIATTISLIFMRFYSYMQKSLYSGTILQPLAIEGYFPDKFAKLNKEGLPISAAKLNLIIVISMATIWLIIPDIIKGSLITTGSFNQEDVFFEMSGFTSFASLIAITIYISVIAATIWLMFNEKIKNKNKFSQWSEMILYCVAVLLLCFVVVYHYYDLVENVVKNHNLSNLTSESSQSAIKAITKLAIELFSTFGMVGFFFIWYRSYYLRKIKTRTVSRQKELDKPFKLLNAKERAQLIDN